MKTFADFPVEQLRYFLQLLRNSRYTTLQDGEDFTSVCFALEEIGLHVLTEKRSRLGQYREALEFLVNDHQKARFQGALSQLIAVRNDKSHQGVFARNAAKKAIIVSETLEACIMPHLKTIEDIMIDVVTYAESFMSLAKVRELMLSHSFSFLPIKQSGQYCLLADYEVARLWRDSKSDERYLLPLKEHIETKRLSLRPAKLIPAATQLQAANLSR